MKLSKTQWLIVCVSIGSLGAMVGSLPSWHDAMTPAFIGALVVNISSHIAGLFTDDPKDRV
jgi:hypothetical protein